MILKAMRAILNDLEFKKYLAELKADAVKRLHEDLKKIHPNIDLIRYNLSTSNITFRL